MVSLPKGELTEEQGHIHHSIVVDEGQAPCRLDVFLASKIAAISRNRIQEGIKQGFITVDGKQAKGSYKVQPGERIVVRLPQPKRFVGIAPQDIPLDIHYEDEALLVVNKPAHMVVHPGHGNWENTLVHALCFHFSDLLGNFSSSERPGLVHRIDKGTSGLLVVAKTSEVLMHLAAQFAAHTTERHYLALVWGEVKEATGTIDMPVGRDKQDRRIMWVYGKDEGVGKEAVTHYEVAERLGYVTLLRCRLETGRTHQIRAHMRYLGHPLFGDERYGGARVVKGPRYAKYGAFVSNCLALLPHQALHAASLGFVHPTTGKKMRFDADPPPAFEEVLARWRRYTDAYAL